MAGRSALKLVASLAAFVFSLGAAAPGAMNRLCRMDARQPAASRLGNAVGLSRHGATCCCERATAAVPARAIAYQHLTSVIGPAAHATESAFWLVSSAGLLHRNLTSLDPGSRVPILLITKSLLI
jgi:hypothetical protein